MAITPWSGSIKTSTYIPYDGAIPAGGTYTHGHRRGSVYHIGQGAGASSSDDLFRTMANITTGDGYCLNYGQLLHGGGDMIYVTSKTILGDYVSLGLSDGHDYTANILLYRTTTIPAGKYKVGNPAYDEFVNVLCADQAYYSLMVNEYDNTYIPRLFTGPLSSLEYLDGTVLAGHYKVVYYCSTSIGSTVTDGTTFSTSEAIDIGTGLWRAYDFTDLAAANSFLDTILPPNTLYPDDIITIIVVPGPHMIIVTIGGVIVTDDLGTDDGLGTRTLTGDFYTGDDIPDDIIHDFVDPVITADTLADIEKLPKMWRARTNVLSPGITQGHEPMYLSTGILMNEMKGQRMMDIFTPMPTTNPNTRD